MEIRGLGSETITCRKLAGKLLPVRSVMSSSLRQIIVIGFVMTAKTCGMQAWLCEKVKIGHVIDLKHFNFSVTTYDGSTVSPLLYFPRNELTIFQECFHYYALPISCQHPRKRATIGTYRSTMWILVERTKSLNNFVYDSVGTDAEWTFNSCGRHMLWEWEHVRGNRHKSCSCSQWEMTVINEYVATHEMGRFRPFPYWEWLWENDGSHLER